MTIQGDVTMLEVRVTIEIPNVDGDIIKLLKDNNIINRVREDLQQAGYNITDIKQIIKDTVNNVYKEITDDKNF